MDFCDWGTIIIFLSFFCLFFLGRGSYDLLACVLYMCFNYLSYSFFLLLSVYGEGGFFFLDFVCSLGGIYLYVFFLFTSIKLWKFDVPWPSKA